VDLNEAIILLWYGSILFLGVLGIRLLVTRLWRSYPAFTLYILALCVESLLLLYLYRHGYRQKIYGRFWTVSRLLVLALEVSAVLAIFNRWTVSFPGIGAFGRRLVVVLMAISIGLALSTLPVAWSSSGWVVAYQIMTIINRGTNACCAVFLILTLGFFYKFGGPVAPNLRRHTWAMTAFVTANAVSYLAMSSHAFALANVLLTSVSIAALGFWILALKGSGELQPVTGMNTEEWEAAEQMNRQLQKLADSVTLTPQGLRKKFRD
jgi:hypothetical protein